MVNLVELFDSRVRDNFNILPKRLLVALSGGIDSMALVLIAKEWADQNSVELFSLTIDHNLRENSSVQAEEIHEIMNLKKIKHEVKSWEGSEVKSNIEAEARKARYEILKKYAKENDIGLILTAHHLDDQIENFFIRLSRGSGIDGLASMSKVSELACGIKLFRPFLEIKKEKLKAYLGKEKYFEDETNEDQKFLRNRIRSLLGEIEDKELIDKRITQTIKHFARAKDYFEQEVVKVFKELVVKRKEGVEVDLQKFKNLHSEIALRLLIKIFKEVGEENYKPRFEKLESLYNKIIGGGINKSTSFAKCLVIRKEENLEFVRELVFREGA